MDARTHARARAPARAQARTHARTGGPGRISRGDDPTAILRSCPRRCRCAPPKCRSTQATRRPACAADGPCVADPSYCAATGEHCVATSHAELAAAHRPTQRPRAAQRRPGSTSARRRSVPRTPRAACRPLHAACRLLLRVGFRLLLRSTCASARVHTCPTTHITLLSETSMPRSADGAVSAMYMGTYVSSCPRWAHPVPVKLAVSAPSLRPSPLSPPLLRRLPLSPLPRTPRRAEARFPGSVARGAARPRLRCARPCRRRLRR